MNQFPGICFFILIDREQNFIQRKHKKNLPQIDPGKLCGSFASIQQRKQRIA